MRHICLWLLIACCFPRATFASERPNLLIILADDMGWGDLGCTGSQVIRTPNIDHLAAEGVLCTRAYVASSVCSPSRAGLLTGRDPRRFGYEGNLNQSARNYATRPELLGLPTTEHTVADQLKPLGYRTAIIGKWHLGTGTGFHPNERGFDHFCGMLGGGHNYFPQPGKHSLERNGTPVEEFSSAYLTDFFTDQAVEFIKSVDDAGDDPWMLYLSYNAPHTPMQATEDDLADFADIKDPRRRTYAAMMQALDRGVGRVVDYIDDVGERDNTLVVFFSDNGGATNNASWNGPLSGAKGCMREGGVRVPMIWSWPGKLPDGDTSSAVVSSLDVVPTFVAAAGGELLPLSDAASHEDAGNRRRAVAAYGGYDGIDMLPVLAGQQPPFVRRLFWRLQGQTAVLRGEDKLIRLSHRPAQLFRPVSDEGEQIDLSDSHAEVAAELFAELADWEANLATVPLWGSSPRWNRNSAQIYDTWSPREEPK